jgi:hypothetical protein
MLILNFTYPLRCLRVPPGVLIPPVEYHWYREIGYGFDDRGSIPEGGNDGNLSLRHRVQTGSGTHSASYPMGTGSSYPGGKATWE